MNERLTVKQIPFDSPFVTWSVDFYRSNSDQLRLQKSFFGEDFDAKVKSFVELTASIQSDFYQSLDSFILKDGLGDVITGDRAKGRLQRYEFYPYSKSGGLHYAEELRIFSNPLSKILPGDEEFGEEKSFKRGYTHELVHAIAGQSYLLIQSKDFVDNSDWMVLNLKSGLRFNVPKNVNIPLENQEFGENLFWLNEALAEEITVDLVGYDMQRYAAERFLFRSLIEQSNGNVKRNQFYRAFFENANVGAPPGERLKEVSGLFLSLNKIYGKGFLARIDRIVKQQGITNAIHCFEEHTTVL